ncbi:MAG: hypothetical protein ACFFE4_02120, partial [Candidatus Thorarchaeota archaeon]
SGPFVHLMFKSQSKNALADDEDLIKEIKFCLEAIGRRLRVYLNRRASIRRTEKRSSLIEKYIPQFVESVYNIASQGESKFKAKLDLKELEIMMKEAIGKKPAPIIKKPEIETPKKIEIEPKEIKIVQEEKPADVEVFSKKSLIKWTVRELKEYSKKRNINIPSRATKSDIIDKIIESYNAKETIIKPEARPKIETEKPEPKVQVEIEPEPQPIEPRITKQPTKIVAKPSISKPKSTQTTLPVITTDRILEVLSDEWQTIKHLIFKLKIKDMMDARYLQLKLKELERKGEVLVELKMGRKHWKLS